MARAEEIMKELLEQSSSLDRTQELRDTRYHRTLDQYYKGLDKQLQEDERIRMKLVMDKGTLSSKLRFLWNYYVSNTNKNDFSVSSLMEEKLGRMEKSISDLEEAITLVSEQDEKVNNSYHTLLDEMEETLNARQAAGSEAASYKEKLEVLKRSMPSVDKDIKSYVDFRRAKRIAERQCYEHTSVYVQSDLKYNEIEAQLKDLDNVTLYIHLLNSSAKLMHMFADKMTTHMELMREISTLLTPVVKAELGFQEKGQELQQIFNTYQDHMKSMLRSRVSFMRDVVGKEHVDNLLNKELASVQEPTAEEKYAVSGYSPRG
mgnify:CR=1 FL=1